MAKHLKATLEVDNVGEMEKTHAKCVLKGEGTVDGDPVELALTITCGSRETFKTMDIDHLTNEIEIVIQDSAQQKLPGA